MKDANAMMVKRLSLWWLCQLGLRLHKEGQRVREGALCHTKVHEAVENQQ